MNRLQHLFGNKTNNLLSVYFTAGYPTLDSTAEIINTLDNKGADMIEIGVPFSDPMADGPVIQESSSLALRNGMTLKHLFIQVAEARIKSPNIPLVLMGYLNPFIQFGIENLFNACQQAGIDALIIPDLPFAEYMAEFKSLSDRYDIPVIMLITPETSTERIHLIDNNCNGFIYMVSAAATTGTRKQFSKEQYDYFNRIDGLKLRNPRLIGFGISNKETFTDACNHSSGAIIGSYFIKCLKSEPTIEKAVDKLMSIKEP